MATKRPFLTDVKTLRARARKHIEQGAITGSYREMIDYVGDKDTTTKRMLEGILAMEEEHADDLVGMLEELKS
jgi:bacterioferritin (cytochrome b1)